MTINIIEKPIEKTVSTPRKEEQFQARYDEALTELAEKSVGFTPICSTREAQVVYDSPYLTNFSAKEYILDNFSAEEAKIDMLKEKIATAKKAGHNYKTYQEKVTQVENRISDAVETARKEHKAKAVYATAAARMVCESCPLIKTCDKIAMYATALSGDERYLYGIVGGVSEQERRNVLRLEEQTGKSVVEVWPEDFNNSELGDSSRKVERKINKFIPKR